MARFQVLISRFWALLRKSRIEKELDEELRLHLDMLIEENLQRGMPPEDARYAALRSFGGVEQVKEAYRQRRGLVMLETLVQDTKQGFRLVLRNPTFSATVIVVVALGIGAACVIFSFAEAAVLHALPYRNPSGLVSVSMTDLKASGEGGGVSIPVFLNWRENGKKIGQFEVTKQLFQTLVGGNEPVQVVGDQVSEGAFEVLGFKPIIGRGFLPSDYKRGSEAVVILSYSSWQELFNGRNDVIGRSVSLDGVQHTVIGVMPAPFMVPESGDLERSYWTPLVFTPKQMADVGDRSLDVWGRLNPGTSAGQAEAALAVLAKHVSRNSTSPWSSKWRLEAVPLVTKVVDDWRSVLILLFGAVACLLAITCANVANLLLARASNRATEIAVRVAVGAGRWRLMCQLLTESVIMGCLGGICGILLAHWGNRVIFQLLPVKLQAPNFRQMGIDPLVLTGTLVISILVGVLFGLAPALKATKLDLVESLKEGNASFSSNRGRMTTQDLFVVSEVAISLVLLVGAGLLARSFLKLEHVQLGFQPSQVLTMRVLLPQYEYAKKEQQIAAYHELLERIRSLPGVQKSGFVTPLPLDRISATVEFPAQPGMASPHGADVLFFGSGFHAVSPGYFSAMGIPLLGGREFTDEDRHNSKSVAIVNETFARQYWPGENPVGKEIFENYPKTTPVLRVVGEVRDTIDLSLAELPRPELYQPYTQYFLAAFAGALVAKTRTPASTAVAMQKAIRSVDPEAPISQIRTMDQVLARNRAGNRFYLLLVGVFALLALVLAAAGIASTVSYAVSQRRHEVGIRMALGAQRGAILGLIAGQTLKLVVAGIALGLAGSFMLTRFVASELYKVSPTDPLTLALVSLMLMAIGVLSSLVPARRATRIDPAETLRAL